MDEMYARLWRYALIVVIVMVAASFVAFLISSMMQTVISGPISHLAGVVGLVANEKDYSVRAVKQGEDELGRLIDGFNDMLNQIQMQDSALQDARSGLEKRVAERTTELEIISKRQEAILSAIPDIIMEVDRNKVYTWANRAGVEFFGEDVTGKEAAFYFEGEQEVYHNVQPLFDGDEQVVYVESWQRRKDGEKRLLAWWCRVLKDAHGHVTGALSTARDITESNWAKEKERASDLETHRLLKQTEQSRLALLSIMEDQKHAEEEWRKLQSQLVQSQRLESIGTLAGGVAHEINNPINGIGNYAQLIADKLPKEDPLQEFAAEIMREAQRVATIVRNLLQFARQEKQSRSPARMVDIVNAVLSLIRTIMRHDQVAIEVNVPANLPKIKCRSQQIQQVIMNLLTNARDALNEKYPGPDKDKIIMVSAQETANHRRVRLTVEDHGIGIAPQIEERIFDPFFTTKPRSKGTGLGLAISHRIIKDHDGELSMESEPGKWTRFHVDLPVDVEKEGEKEG